MRTVITPKNLLCICLMYTCLFQPSVFAQNDKEKQPKQAEEDGTVHIRIEKYENGKKKVIEKTYKSGQVPGMVWGDTFMEADTLFGDFGKNFPLYTDSTFSKGPSAFYFHTPQSDNDHLFLFKEGDSLRKHTFHFGFDQKNIDSLIDRQLGNSEVIIMDLNKRLKSMNVDSLIQGFNFQWSEPDFNFHFNQEDDLNLLLDKDLYEVEEVETEKGKKMLKINPKGKKKNEEKKNLKKSEQGMQLSPSDFTLYANTVDRKVTLHLNLPDTGNTTITIEDSEGKKVFEERLKDFTGKYAKQINLSKEEDGVYVVHVIQNTNHLSRKISIQ